MKRPDNKVYLAHILECMDMLKVHLGAYSIDTFEQNVTVRDACLRTLQIMSESCTRLTDDIRASMPDIEWHRIRGFRNILVHDYTGELDIEQVKIVMHEYLPILKQAVEQKLKELS